MSKTLGESTKPTEEWKKCCRICFSGKSKGRLLSICNCKGSLGLVHKECQQKWLTVKKTNKCELCGTNLNVKRVHKDFNDWLKSKDNDNRFYLCLDVIKGMIVIPITFWAVYLIVPNCMRLSKSIFTSVMLMMSALLLIVMTCLWFAVCFDHHCSEYQLWKTNRYKYVLKKPKPKMDIVVDNMIATSSVAHWNNNGIALLSAYRTHLV